MARDGVLMWLICEPFKVDVARTKVSPTNTQEPADDAGIDAISAKSHPADELYSKFVHFGFLNPSSIYAINDNPQRNI